MWIELAHFATIIALLMAVVQLMAPVVGVLALRPAWVRVGRQAAYVVAVALTLAVIGVVISFLNHDFSVKYVAEHSSLSLPFFYRLTALWGGHEGSLLFWAWLLGLYTAMAVWRHWSSHPHSVPVVLSVLGAVITGFLVLILFLSSPFERLPRPPMDGRDLNPMLQDPGMVFHPPFLYMGYVGFAIPFAFALAALVNGRITDEWIVATRRWTLFSWAMLSTGIVFGAYWAYHVLGWGGYWAWDPVENASFIPWLVATAFLHSNMVQERRHMFMRWNLFLIITTFSLSLLGTFLVRSGVLSSVHAFASDPGRGVYILMFMTVVLLASFGLLVFRSDRLKSEVRLESLLSTEAAFLFNNLFLVVAALTVLLGTLYPLAMETLGSAKVTVGAPYYNKVFVPIMFIVLALMGVGPMLVWRGMQAQRLLRAVWIPLAGASIAAGLAFSFLGVRHPYGIVCIFLALFVAVSHGLDWGAAVRKKMIAAKQGFIPASSNLIRRNKRRYGGFMVHLGIVVMTVGFVGSGLFQEEKELVLAQGDFVVMGDWRLTFTGIHSVQGSNWTAQEALITAETDHGKKITLRPQKRVYNNHPMPATEAAISSHFLEDIYVVLGEPVSDANWAFRLYRNPLVSWVWGGAEMMALGILWSLLQGRSFKSKKRVDGTGPALQVDPSHS
ncbi:MAG: heme lyase CcmF/NrfE family subunit [Magnetococcales bacterium]|nr:heme lyase CcmF/NrfE family subunit [Magnetococcales bacterium]